MWNNYAILFLLFFFISGNVALAQAVQEDVATIQETADNSSLRQSVHIYPNPVQSYLTVHSKMPITKVEIYTLLGRRVRLIQSGYASIYLGDMNSGIYMIKVYSNDLSITKKLVKR
jgi:hypothetical protein